MICPNVTIIHHGIRGCDTFATINKNRIRPREDQVLTGLGILLALERKGVEARGAAGGLGTLAAPSMWDGYSNLNAKQRPRTLSEAKGSGVG
jgi:hypothetical protein